MTQALNLALFANKLNTSGQTDNTGLQNSAINIATTSPITGGANTSLGGTVTIAHANSGVTANTYTAATITVNAQGHITSASSNTIGAGTVTSVATGNGLQGGTITSTGTLSVACPAFNTVGSYIFGGNQQGGSFTFNAGSNYSAGSGSNQIQATNVRSGGGGDTLMTEFTGVSGTWKWMGSNTAFNDQAHGAVCCRVS